MKGFYGLRRVGFWTPRQNSPRKQLSLKDPMEECDAVIVGGGVAGAAMGVALGRHDVNAVVLERRREVGEINRGDALQIAAVRALDRLGALDAIFQAGGQKTKRMVFSHYRKGRLGCLDISAVFGPPFNYIVTLAHEKIETALINEADRRGIQTRRGHTGKAIRRAGDDMVLSVHGEQGDYADAPHVLLDVGQCPGDSAMWV